jgi:hypothetical protein
VAFRRGDSAIMGLGVTRGGGVAGLLGASRPLILPVRDELSVSLSEEKEAGREL